MTDLKSRFWRSQLVPMEPSDIPDIESVFRELERDAEDWLKAEGVAVADRSMSPAVGVRYKGQGHHLTTPYVADCDAAVVARRLRSNLDEAHARQSETLTPTSDRLVGDDDTPLERHLLDEPGAPRKSEAQPSVLDDDLGWESIVLVADGLGQATALRAEVPGQRLQ